MTAPLGSVRFHQSDHTLTFRVTGRGTMPLSLSLRRYAERCLAAGIAAIRIDLRECTYMDSTFLGTLLTLHKALQRQAGALQLVMPSAACTRILQSMGLDEMLPATADDTPPATWADLPLDIDDAASRRNVTQAHEELAQLPGPVGKQFEAVVRCLEDTAKKDPPPE